MDLITMICTGVILLANIVIYICQFISGKRVKKLAKAVTIHRDDDATKVEIDINDSLLTAVKVLFTAKGLPFVLQSDGTLLIKVDISRFEEIKALLGNLGVSFDIEKLDAIGVLEITLK